MTRPGLRMLTGGAIAIAGFAWLFHDVPLRAALDVTGHVAWPAAMLAVVSDIAAYGCQGLRWRVLLQPVGRASWLDTTEAIYAGLFANELLPFRPGEALRGVLMARALDVSIARVVSSVLVERLFDGVWLACGLAAAALTMALPPGLARAARLFSLAIVAIVVALAIVLAALAARPARRRALPRLLREPAEELAGIGSSRAAASAFALSLVFLLLQALAFWFAARAVALPMSIPAAIVVLLVQHLGTMVPNAPANLGTYQVAVVLGLALFGVNKATATGFSLFVFVLLTGPLWVIGAAATWRLRRRAQARAARPASWGSSARDVSGRPPYFSSHAITSEPSDRNTNTMKPIA